ncbi:signal peptidase I [Oligella urethralis]|uniref:signal peptidase I n=1 Tax=Oligella urethralis TaxID=90245 RepID=UPI000C9B4F06|nr:signal peptidase I [Oligella urethralis]MDK6202669.1 signal peptidase I [Oligella urethralis]PMC18642.1 signal peptidase I [Oligella urethralis]
MDYALILLLLLIIAIVVKVIDRLLLRPRRVAAYGEAEAKHRGWFIDLVHSFFPVILAVFVLRSFIVEPFRIPSGSMLPTLEAKDMILANKFSYGVVFPVINKKLIPVGSPQRGDVAVFRYPPQPEVDYIKRIVALPGDSVVYHNHDKTLTVNGQLYGQMDLGPYINPEQQGGAPEQFAEMADGKTYNILKLPYANLARPHIRYPFMDHCEYTAEQLSCTVPQGHYFALGDNRDNSVDSRFWGFVPEENIVGKAFFVWMNLGFNFDRIGSIN